MAAEEGGAGAALKGLRLLTIDRGPEGYGFHMYTNKTLKVSSDLLDSLVSPSFLYEFLCAGSVCEVGVT